MAWFSETSSHVSELHSLSLRNTWFSLKPSWFESQRYLLGVSEIPFWVSELYGLSLRCPWFVSQKYPVSLFESQNYIVWFPEIHACVSVWVLEIPGLSLRQGLVWVPEVPALSLRNTCFESQKYLLRVSGILSLSLRHPRFASQEYAVWGLSQRNTGLNLRIT